MPQWGLHQVCFAGSFTHTFHCHGSHSLQCLCSFQSEIADQAFTQTELFFWSTLKVPRAWGTHLDIHTKGFQGSCNGNQIVFPRNVLHSVIIFILLQSKWNFQPSWEDGSMYLSFWNYILLHLLFSNAHCVNYHIWLLWRQWQNPSFLIQNQEKFKLNILLYFHFEAQIHGLLQNCKKICFIFKDERKCDFLKKSNIF